jgi:hypothetical protein
MMLNAVSMGWIMGFKPFKSVYLQNVASIDEMLVTIASATYFAYFH